MGGTSSTKRPEWNQQEEPNEEPDDGSQPLKGHGAISATSQLENVTDIIKAILDGYDIRLRPNFGGEFFCLEFLRFCYSLLLYRLANRATMLC